MLDPSAVRNVCVTADDYGMSRGTNEAIEALAGRGLLTAVSVMTHAGADLSSLERLVATDVSIGVHLAFTDGLALSDAVSRRLPRNAAALVLHLVRHPGHVRGFRAEAAAQVARLRARCDRIAFVNGHEHVHLLPLFWPTTMSLTRQVGARAVRTARTARPGADAAGLVAAASRLSSRLDRANGACELNPLGIGSAGRLDAASVRRLLTESGAHEEDSLAELCMHPSLDLDADRRREFEFIASGALDSAVRACGYTRLSSLARVATQNSCG